MTKPWMKEIPLEMSLFGPVCPFCCEIKTHLVTKLFQEGIGWICEDCRRYEKASDMYVPPAMKEFKKRLFDNG